MDNAANVDDSSLNHKQNIDEYILLFRYLCTSRYNSADVAQIENTLKYVWNIYKQQKPVDAEILINELIDIATIGIEMMNIDVPSVISILLFPLFEEKLISKDNIEANFDSEVVEILKGLLKISKISVKEKEQKDFSEKQQKLRLHDKFIAAQTENHIKLLLTYIDDIRIVIIRLAFRLNLLRKMMTTSTAERIRIARETANVYAPIAHRLGLYLVKSELEERSMMYLEAQMYHFISTKLAETKTDREAFIRDFIQPLNDILAKENLDFEIKGRPKSIHSIWLKMQKQSVPFEEVYDLFAIRIILNKNYAVRKEEKDDCWKVYSMITDVYQPNPKRLRDWISHPKGTGYESLHTTVLSNDRKWVEVQIRTRRMDDIAEKGQAAHWKYKEGTTNKKENLDSLLATLRDSLDKSENVKTESDEAKRELYLSEIFIFTPEREIKRLRAESTVLDFAYSVHSNLGEHCIGGEVNGRFQPINFVLKNGDEVKIVTSKNQQPNPEWLKIAKSPKTIAKVKKFLFDAQYQNLERGKEIIQHKCEQAKVEFSDAVLRKLLKHYNKYQNFQELYEAVGREEIDTSVIKDIIAKSEIEEKPATDVVVDYNKIKERKLKRDYLVIDSLGKIDYELAKCCSPVLGDEIFGFITASKGTKIHKTTCNNAIEMQKRYPYRMVKAKWTDGEFKSAFKATINIESAKKDSLFNNVYKLLSEELKLSIAKIKVDDKLRKNYFTCQVVVYVNNKNHLNVIIDKVSKIQNIVRVYRG